MALATIGAWQVAARYSWIDLNDGNVFGGQINSMTLGVNWFPNPNVKVMLNYLLIDVDRLNPAGPGNTSPFGPAPNTPPLGVQIGQDLDVFALRTQFSF